MSETSGVDAERMEEVRTRRLLAFELGGVTCALPLHEIKEVLLAAALFRPPAVPSFLEGFLNLGGFALGVVRLEILLGLPAKPWGLYSHIVVTGAGRPPLAFLADRARGIVEAPQEGLMPVAEERTFNNCVLAEIDANGSRLHLLDLDKLLLREEAQRLARLREIEQSRLRGLEGPPA